MPTTAKAAKQANVAITMWPSAPRSVSSAVSVENTRQGVPMVVTMAVRNSDSNGRSSRPQRKPIPEQTRIGATMAASSANTGGNPRWWKARRVS